MDYDKAASWNPALAYTQILAKPDEELMLTYQAGLFSRKCFETDIHLCLKVTAGQRPVVTQRDFTFLVSSVREGGVWVAGPGREMEEQAGLVTGAQEVLGTLKHSRLG